VFARTSKRFVGINATFIAQVADVIATDGGADSRDFLTKVQVFSFSLERPRPSRNRPRLATFAPFPRFPAEVIERFRLWLPSALRFSRSRDRARLNNRRSEFPIRRDRDHAFIALTKRRLDVRVVYASLSRCEKESEESRKENAANYSLRVVGEYMNTCTSRNNAIRLLEFDNATLNVRLMPRIAYSIFSNVALVSLCGTKSRDDRSYTHAHTHTHVGARMCRRKEQNLPSILAIYIRRTSVVREGRYIQSI